MKNAEFLNEEYYHIYNRGVDKREIFLNKADYQRFFGSLRDFNTVDPEWKKEISRGETSDKKEIVEILAFCLNPNHFHLILRQKIDKGITEFMRRIGTGYTMYFNKRYDRSGVLFQGKFKSVHVSSNEYLLYLSAYVNCNCEVHNISKAETYPWCSFSNFLGKSNGIIEGREMIMCQFRNVEEYREYSLSQAVGMRQKKDLTQLFLE